MLIDAHNHLQDPRLEPYREACVTELRRLGVKRWVVNGTREADWEAVAKLAEQYPDEVVPCFGLHPWYVGNYSRNWSLHFRRFLDMFPNAGIGEIGLDKWIRNYDLPEQLRIFRWQLALAAEQDRPVMIHCLKAWGTLRDVLREEALPERGFLLHSFAGPAEMIDRFAELGGYFSFSGYFIHGRKAAVQEAFKRVPPERLLIETDAPDMNLPESHDRYRLRSPSGERINHPGNLVAVYDFAAEMLGIDRPTLEACVDDNLRRLLGW